MNNTPPFVSLLLAAILAFALGGSLSVAAPLETLTPGPIPGLVLSPTGDRGLSSTWTPVGPSACCGGPLAVARALPPAAGTVWLAGGETLAMSVDRGSSWRFTTVVDEFSNLGALTADGSLPRALWAANDRAVYRTEDGGTTWRPLSDDSYPEALGTGSPREIQAAQGWLFVLTDKRLLASSDGGRSWRVVHHAGDNSVLRAFAAQPQPGAAPVLYVSRLGPVDPEFFMSPDGGHSWLLLLALPLPPAGVDHLIASAAAVFATMGGDLAGVFRSTDRGATWRPVLGGRPSDRFEAAAIALDRRAPAFVYSLGVRLQGPFDLGLWRSRDGGASWKLVGNPGFAGALFVEPGAATLYAWNGGTLARSLDRGASWSPVFDISYGESSWAQLTFRRGDPARRLLTVGFAVHRTDDGGATWRWLPAPRLAAVDLDPQDPRRLLGVGGSFARLSTDGGTTWQTRTSSLWYAESLLRLGGKKLLAAGCGVARTTDNGLTWRETLPCFPTPSEAGRWTRKLEANPRHPGVVYALGFVAEIELPHGLLTNFPSFLWRSDDNGGTWKKVTRNLRVFAIDPSDGRVYGARGRTLLASDDLGQTWHTVATTPWPLDDLAIDPLDPERLFGLRGTNGTVSCSANGGLDWSQLPSGGPRGEIGRLYIEPADPRTLYAASRFGVSNLPLPASGCPEAPTTFEEVRP